jgi:GLPGLI family protein
MLYAEKNNSIFYVEKQMEDIQSSMDNLSLIFFKINGKIYTYLDENIQLHEKNSFGSNFIIENKYKSQYWELTSESKVIGDYKCFKAVFYETTLKNNKIVIWYAPSLNYSYGPAAFVGFPGLVLEVEVLNKLPYRIVLDNIKFNYSKEIDYSKPKNGKYITLDEYNEIGEKMRQRQKELYKN